MLAFLYKILLNVNFDTECKMLGPRLEKCFFFTKLQLQDNNIQCGKL